MFHPSADLLLKVQERVVIGKLLIGPLLQHLPVTDKGLMGDIQYRIGAHSPALFGEGVRGRSHKRPDQRIFSFTENTEHSAHDLCSMLRNIYDAGNLLKGHPVSHRPVLINARKTSE